MPPPRHAPPRPAAPGAQLLNQAIALHQAGRLDEAESHYRQVLQATPGHFDATHLLGVIALMLGACADYYILSLRSLQTTTDALIVGDLIRHGLLLPGFVIVLALPSITKRLNLRRELKYRRLHGKWRWEH